MIRNFEGSPYPESITFEEFLETPTGRNGYIDLEHSTYHLFGQQSTSQGESVISGVWSLCANGLNVAKGQLAGCGEAAECKDCPLRSVAYTIIFIIVVL